MKIRRFVTTEDVSGAVSVRCDEPVANTEMAPTVTPLWGWDALPTLPVSPNDIDATYSRRSLFAPPGGVNVNLIIFPAIDATPGEIGELDMSNSGLVMGEAGRAHRTDSIDFVFILEGEVVARHPGEDAEIRLRPGDFLVQNGAMHEWENKTSQTCVAAAVVLTAPREGA
jgi:hypothetical protein